MSRVQQIDEQRSAIERELEAAGIRRREIIRALGKDPKNAVLGAELGELRAVTTALGAQLEALDLEREEAERLDKADVDAAWALANAERVRELHRRTRERAVSARKVQAAITNLGTAIGQLADDSDEISSQVREVLHSRARDTRLGWQREADITAVVSPHTGIEAFKFAIAQQIYRALGRVGHLRGLVDFASHVIDGSVSDYQVDDAAHLAAGKLSAHISPPSADDAPPVEVVATAQGWDGKVMREPGETFEMPAGSQGKWFKPAPPKVAKPKAPPALPADKKGATLLGGE